MSLIEGRTEFVSIATVLPDFYEDNGIIQKDVDESLLLKWAEDKISDITTDRQLSHKLAWLSIYNYKVDDFPKDLVTINEVAYRASAPKDSCGIRGYEITQYAQQTHEEGCTLELNVVCPSCHKTGCNCRTEGIVVDINTAFEIAHPEMYYSKYAKVSRFGYGNSVYGADWKLLCPSDNDWFGINKHLPDCANLTCTECPGTYRLNPPVMETSFEEGEILISYMGMERDSNGDIMIPKHRDVFDAILHHLTYKWYRREYIKKREASDRVIYLEAQQMAEIATTKAITRIGTPSFAEFSKFWSKNKWSKIDNAYTKLMAGKAPIAKLPSRNIYNS